MTATDYRLVLVTGATGFIGAHVVDVLLSHNIAVRVASRTVEKANALISARPDFAHLLSYVLIDDFSKPSSSLTAAVAGVDGVIHVASPFSYEVSNVEAELILPAIAGVKSVMQAAKAAGTVKRVVLTSSFASVLDVSKGDRPGYTYTGADWNPLTYEEARVADPVVGYRGSKKFAELAAWEFEEKEKPQFDLVTLCPPMTFGPVVHPVTHVKDLNVSNAVLWSIATDIDPLPVSRVPVWIDVRDLATAHVEALLRPEVGGKRYVPASPEFFTYQLAANIIREAFPWAKKAVNVGNPDEAIPDSYKLDSESVSSQLGVNFTPFKDMVVQAIEQFSKMEGSPYK